MRYILMRRNLATGKLQRLKGIEFKDLDAAKIYKKLFSELTSRHYIVQTIDVSN